MTLNLDDLEATAKAATPGPWSINWESDEYHAGMPRQSSKPLVSPKPERSSLPGVESQPTGTHRIHGASSPRTSPPPRKGATMVHEAASRYWSRELEEDVEIVVNGWVNGPQDYALYISGTHVVAFKRMAEIEEYLGMYFMKKGAETT